MPEASWGRATVAPGSSSFETRLDKRAWAPQAGGRYWEERPAPHCLEAGWFCCCNRTGREGGGADGGVTKQKNGRDTGGARQRQQKMLISSMRSVVINYLSFFHTLSHGTFRNLSVIKCKINVHSVTLKLRLDSNYEYTGPACQKR